MGYDFTGGRIFDFCIDFSMGLTTVQRYCAACDTFLSPGTSSTVGYEKLGFDQYLARIPRLLLYTTCTLQSP